MLRDDIKDYQIAPSKALTRLMRNRGVKLVVLNACYSKYQAQSLVEVVDTIVGTSTAVDDEAARRFSVAFYRTIGGGHSVGDAFEDAGAAIELGGLDDVYEILGNREQRFFVPLNRK